METRRRARQRWMDLRDELNGSGLSRRDVARMGLLVAGGVLLDANGRPARAQSIIPEQDFPPSPPTRPFVQPLIVRRPATPEPLTPPPNPNAHQYYRRFPARRTYRFNTTEFPFSSHPDLPPSMRWGYDGQIPGPLIDARYGEPVVIRIVNNLPTLAQHRGFGIPQIITHLHNFHSASESDGGPWDWYGRGRSKDHHYTMARAGFTTNVPAEFRDEDGGDVRETLTTLFFHDHRADFTAPNVYRGLLGIFHLHDERDTGDETDPSPLAWRLPSDPFDVPLVLQDQRFHPQTGRLFFDQFDLDGHLGDKYVVNGRIQPFFNVQRRKYRFRVYTPGPARIYQLVFRYNGRNLPFTQVTNVSGNFLQAPRRNLTRIEMVPAYRVDLILDFSQIPAGARIHLANVLPQDDGRRPERGEFLNPDNTNNQLMEFRVVGGAVRDPSRVPSFFRPLPPSNLPVARTRVWRFERGNGQWQINGELFDPEADHTPARLRNPRNQVRRNTNELWVLENHSGGWEHPIHIHFEEGIAIRSEGVPVPEAQRFRSDVHHLSVDRREVEVMMSFRDFPDPNFDALPGIKGRYVIHCHNTTHEDHAMMQTWTVVEP